MDSNIELAFVQGAIAAANGGVGYIASSLITGYFLSKSEIRKYTNDFKAQKFREVADKMVEDGVLSYKRIRDMKNLWDIAEEADDYMRKNCGEHYEIDKSGFDLDWFTKFLKSAADVSDKEVQKFWARILAGEFENRGSMPLSVIHALSLMNLESANAFLNLSRFCFRDGKKQNCMHPLVFFIKNRTLYESVDYCISFSTLKDLERIGLIYCDFKDEFIFERAKLLWYGNHKLLVENANGIVQGGNVTLTGAGQALLSVLHDKLPEPENRILEHVIHIYKNRQYRITLDDRQY